MPKDKKKKLRATLEMSLGRMIYTFLKTSVKIIKEKRFEEPNLEELFNKLSVTFDGIKIELPDFKILNDVE
jgi:hypothetical protein